MLNFFNQYNLNFGSADFNQYNFQSSATPLAENIVNLHHYIWVYCVYITGFILWIILITVKVYGLDSIYLFKEWKTNTNSIVNIEYLKKKLNIQNIERFDSPLINDLSLLDKEKQTRLRVNHGEGLEIIWTIIPGIILLIIAVPSFYLLYSVDDIIDPAIFIKVIGHQWYWSYEWTHIDSLKINEIEIAKYNYDSYMLNVDDLTQGQLRLLEVDNPLIVPVYTHICFLVTSTDVLHSWAIPSLGIKIDAVPGRLNQTNTYIIREGYYYGQCSELCGVNHGFMPILVIAK